MRATSSRVVTLFYCEESMKTPKTQPNHTVREWLEPYVMNSASVSGVDYVKKDSLPLPPAIDSMLIGVSYLDASKDLSKPKLKPNTLLKVLASVDTISTANTKECLPWLGRTSIDNYTAGARVASNAIYDYLVKSGYKRLNS